MLETQLLIDMKAVYLYILIITSITVHAQVSDEGIILNPSYKAGDSIELILNKLRVTRSDILLFVDHSFGSEIIEFESISNQTVFKLPAYVSNKSGLVNFKLIEKGKTIWLGKTQILPDTTSASTLEAYCGPKHLLTGKNDFSMAIASVLDQYDNPYLDGTSISFHALIQNKMMDYDEKMNHLISYKRIFAPQKAGYGSVSITHKEIGHKAFRLDFYANDPINYSISYNKQHKYADGNQLIEFKTSTLVDANDNLMGNGTLIYFYIIDDQGTRTSATVESIEGVGRFSIPVPHSSTTWNVSSEIPYYAKSNSLDITFESSIQKVPVLINEKNIEIGPVKGFMGQFVKDGILVNLKLFNEDYSYEYVQALNSGVTKFDLNPKFISAGTYSVIISIADYSIEHKNVISYE